MKKVRIILKEVSQFYDEWLSTTVADSTLMSQQLLTLRGTDAHCWPNADGNYLLLCHGFNVNAVDKTYWPATVFKRLWWQNYTGRIGFFKWPCKVTEVDGSYPKVYDDSDKEAWDTGAILKILLEGLHDADFIVHLLAHSQGNIVAGNALRQLNPTKKVATYIATQAAISISCYQHCQEPYFSTQKCPDVRANYPGWNSGGPILATVKNKATRMYNFYNCLDYALTSAWFISWKRNNSMRPDYDYNYEGNSVVYNESPSNGMTPSRFYKSSGSVLPTGQTDLKFPIPQDDHQVPNLSDTHEIFAYAAHAWGEPIGMLSSVPDFTSFCLQGGLLNYNERHYSHSRQFRSNISAELPYWKQVLISCNLQKHGFADYIP